MIAIPVSENNLNSIIDDRFGRCPFFCFYSTETGKTEFKKNIPGNDAGGSGLQVSEFLVNEGIKKVYAVEFGPRAKALLDKLKVETRIIESGHTVREIINMFNN
jgi:predicted Fe-Mo cluster-binding NifX family protein